MIKVLGDFGLAIVVAFVLVLVWRLMDNPAYLYQLQEQNNRSGQVDMLSPRRPPAPLN